MATIGQSLAAPEPGWKRIDGANEYIKYRGSIANYTNVQGLFEGTMNGTSGAGSGAILKFKGTSIRLIYYRYSNRTNNVAVRIDGVYAGSFTENGSEQTYTLGYEKTGLEDKEHIVQFINVDSANYFNIDAIDINEEGELLPAPSNMVIGFSFTAPEPGWRRYDDTDTKITKSSNIAKTTDSRAYGGSFSTSTGDHLQAEYKFHFYGTKLRIFSLVYPTHTKDVRVVIDGVEYRCNEVGESQFQTLIFEVTGLPEGEHSVRMYNMENNRMDFEAVDIDETGYLRTPVGQQLNAPEPGWKRFDDSDPRIIYSGTNWEIQSASGMYNGSHHQNRGGTMETKFRFYGTKFRIISLRYGVGMTIKVSVDGNPIETSSVTGNGSNTTQILTYEKTGLELGYHTVTLSNSGDWYSVDAIDIDSTGRLLHLDEVLMPDELEVGKRIRCHYQASSNTVGVFSGLGKETSDLIPPASSGTPNGDFYFLMVDESNGVKKLIADRVIQHSISWDKLNESGIAARSGLPIELGLNLLSFTIRLLTGGMSSTDKNNEWDQYIASSSLGGTITPGDNNVWNWKSATSWTSSIPSNDPTKRVGRGRDSLTYYGQALPSYVGTTTGFRPVLEVKILTKNKTFILANGKYLRWNDTLKTWDTISIDLPSKSQFEQEGMEDLSVLNRVNGYSPLDELTGEIEVVVWTEEINAQKNLNMAAIPQDQLVLPTKDINIRSVENIDSFILNVTQAGQGAIKTVVSFDKGTTWYTRSSGSWIETDLANIKTEGITPAALNTITSSEWATLRGTSNTVRFAYHLSIEEITDIATVNDLISQMDMKGTWKKAVHGIDYDYEYPNNDQLSVTIYQNGDYKINY